MGDNLDGFNAQTTRGGHALPQNMTDEESFDTYVNVHKIFFDSLVENNMASEYKAYFVTRIIFVFVHLSLQVYETDYLDCPLIH